MELADELADLAKNLSAQDHDHYWVPVGLQDLVSAAPPPTPEMAEAERRGEFIYYRGETTRRYIVHACSCGDWRLIPMEGDFEARIVRPAKA